MKLSVRLAGLCGSGAFILSALPGFYQQAKPPDFEQMATVVLPGMNIIETMLISLAGSIVAGFIGYLIGDILSNPKGHPKKKKQPKATGRPLSPVQPPLAVAEAEPQLAEAPVVPEATLPDPDGASPE